jgi:AcrR family transcriptional regulator
MAEVVCSDGFACTTVEKVIRRARVSRRTFYELFPDRHACFRAVFEETLDAAAGTVCGSYREGGRWVDRMRGALLQLLLFLDREPGLARLCVMESLGGDAAMLARRAEVLRALADAVDDGRRSAARGASPSPLAAEGVVGAVVSIIYARLQAGAVEPLAELLPPLMSLVVLPFLGPAAASRELSRAAPDVDEVPPREHPATGDVLERVDMRITYRTLRVLEAVAARPAITNGEVAQAAGIRDAGQMSKMLTRLRSAGLLSNGDSRRAGRAGNAWRLTEKGEELRLAVGGAAAGETGA